MASYMNVIYLGMLVIASNIENSLSAAVPENDGALRAVSNGVNDFSVDFIKTVAVDEPNNLICSPVSVSMVLSMAAFGAGGETAEEMRSALHLPNDDSVSRSGFASLFDTLNSVEKIDLHLANKIFIAENFVVKPAFKELTAKSFKSEIQNVDFDNTKTASSTINAWGSAKTNGHIKEVVQPDNLDGAAMVLVNAVYFKGNWKKKFAKSLTAPKTFYINENTTIDVPMMQITHKYNYGVMADLDAKFVELPYAHENEEDAISMYIILPNTVNGLKKAENNFHKNDFRQFYERRQMTNMNLSIPKFKIESSLNLESTLTKMGMGRIFSNAADFTGIAESSPLKMSKVIQKAFIEVSEEGSKAAAVTAIVATPVSAPAPPRHPLNIEVDRPFIYAIVHGSTNTILFQGHITNPSS